MQYVYATAHGLVLSDKRAECTSSGCKGDDTTYSAREYHYLEFPDDAHITLLRDKNQIV